MKTIVVTGGIGSGKSCVCAFLAGRGIPVYDSDSRAKDIYRRFPSLAAMVTPDIFNDPNGLDQLEKRLYPVLLDDFRNWCGRQCTPFVAFESALVLQKPFFDGFGDVVLLVTAPDDVRLARAVARGNVSAESAKDRMRLQRDERYNPRVDYIIENVGSENDLKLKVEEFLDKINYGKREN